ncbi:MAG: FRG domain-containing protein [Allosphingosinicella sp.]
MEVIGQRKIWTYCDDEKKASVGKCVSVRKGPGHTVKNFMELATKIAELQFLNRDFVLLFRGQARDFRSTMGNTMLKPTIMRGNASESPPGPDTLRLRYERLARAEAQLVARYRTRKLPGQERLQRQQILRWAILQHYEVCPTPLLDVTHSLRIAASFGSTEADEAFIFVLGVPHISGAVTASAEAGLQIVRLASVCPPSAVRPHIQEGYLLGEYPDLSGTDQKQWYGSHEIDFGRRLIAKFRYDPARFWYKSEAFPKVPERALYPPASEDPLCELANEVSQEIGPPTA